MALIYDVSFDSTTRVLSLLDKAGNVISSCEVPSKAVDDIAKPLTFRATQNGSTVKLTTSGSPSGSFQTSRDGGNTWTNYSIGTAITLNTGDEVSFRAKSDRTSGQGNSDYFYFVMTGKIEAWHNVMSLYRTNDFATYESVVEYAFRRLFMSCISLTKAPALPATTLADSCYDFMFDGCTSLTKSPELTATTLADNCYRGMFYGCGSLNEVRCKIPSSYSGAYIYRCTTGTTQPPYPWLSNVSSTGTFYTNADANWPSGSSGIPKNWTRVPAVDDITKPLTFKATNDGSTVTLKCLNRPQGDYFETSRDGGNTWKDYTIGSKITLNTGDEVSFRTKYDRTSAQSRSYVFYFEMTGKIEAWHNVMSLYRTNDFATYESVVGYAFFHLFRDCTSLTKAPALPATKLAAYCYADMFLGCQSLTKAPVLPATTLASNCYSYMFSRCRSLKEVRIAATTTATDALKDWLKDVSATGDFYCNPNATIFPTGASGIPANWNRHALADYPVTP